MPRIGEKDVISMGRAYGLDYHVRHVTLHEDIDHTARGFGIMWGHHYCGYVTVPAGHPWHGLGYAKPPIVDIDVHGGITYAEADGR
jgi:hypothetical protein